MTIRTTELMNFRNCALRWHNEHGEGGKIQPPSAAMIEGTRAHDELYEHLLGGRWEHVPKHLHFMPQYFDIAPDNVEVELSLQFDGVTLMGHADLVTVADIAYVMDFKTYAPPDDDFQLKTYCLMLIMQHNIREAWAWFGSIRLGYYKPYKYSFEELQWHYYRLKFLIERLLHYKRENNWPASIGPHCDNCNFAGSCLKRQLAEAPTGFDSPESAAEFKQLYKAAKKQDDAATDVIKSHLLENGLGEWEHGGKKYSVTTSNTLR